MDSEAAWPVRLIGKFSEKPLRQHPGRMGMGTLGRWKIFDEISMWPRMWTELAAMNSVHRGLYVLTVWSRLVGRNRSEWSRVFPKKWNGMES